MYFGRTRSGVANSARGPACQRARETASRQRASRRSRSWRWGPPALRFPGAARDSRPAHVTPSHRLARSRPREIRVGPHRAPISEAATSSPRLASLHTRAPCGSIWDSGASANVRGGCSELSRSRRRCPPSHRLKIVCPRAQQGILRTNRRAHSVDVESWAIHDKTTSLSLLSGFTHVDVEPRRT